MRYSIIALAAFLSLTGCKADQPSADQKDSAQQETIADEAVRQVPLPTITNFAARRTLKAAYEAEDKQVPTYSYHFSAYHNCYVPLGGDAHTFGYPIPGATQMTNPQVIGYARSQAVVATLPQADPDTTFKPASENATIMLQLNKVTGHTDVTYSEPDVFTRTTPVDPAWVCRPNQ